MTLCVSGNCTIREALITQRVSSTACGAPVRDQSSQARIACWILFSISVVFVSLRFLSRSKYQDGPGYGWDDWTMLAVLVFLTLQQVGVDLSKGTS